MPHAIVRDAETRNQGLTTLLVQCQDGGDLPLFMMERFPANHCAVLDGNPMQIGKRSGFTMPRAALVGVDGTILADGQHLLVAEQIETLIPKELEKLRQGWGATPELCRIRALVHDRENFAKARQLLADLKVGDAAKEDLFAARRELSARVKMRFDLVERAFSEGRWVDAEAGAKALRDGTRGVEEWEQLVTEIEARLASPEGQKLLAVDRQLAAVMDAVRAEKPTRAHATTVDQLFRGIERTALGRRLLDASALLHRAVE